MIWLVNPNGNAATTRMMCGIVRRVLPSVTGWTAPGGPPFILSDAQLEAAGRQVAAFQAPPTCDGVIVAAFGDPGRAALAARLAADERGHPVIGIGAAAAAAASRDGRRFAVATTTPGLREKIDALMESNAGPGHYLGCFLTRGNPARLMADQPILDAALSDAIARAEAAGAERVIIGGGPLAEAALRLAGIGRVPLIHPLLEAAHLLRGMQRPIRNCAEDGKEASASTGT